MSNDQPTQQHSTHRTSPFGEDYVGTCFLCGKTGITVENMLEECKNTRGLTQGEALIEALEKAESPCQQPLPRQRPTPQSEEAQP